MHVLFHIRTGQPERHHLDLALENNSLGNEFTTAGEQTTTSEFSWRGVAILLSVFFTAVLVSIIIAIRFARKSEGQTSDTSSYVPSLAQGHTDQVAANLQARLHALETVAPPIKVAILRQSGGQQGSQAGRLPTYPIWYVKLY